MLLSPYWSDLSKHRRKGWSTAVVIAFSLVLVYTGTSGRRATSTTLFLPRSIMSSSEGTSGASGAVVVYVTVPSQEVAEKIAALLVNPDHRLAACVNIVPGLTSIYWWNGEVQKDSELLLMIKTETRLVSNLTEVVKSNHPYDECEVISLPIVGGSASYIQWIHNSISG
ncbi:g324 [Coccomyxa elongata]